MISYAPLWETMKRKKVTQYQMISKHHVSRGTLDTLRKNKSITLNTLEQLCRILDCEIGDVVRFEEIEE